MRNCLRGFPVPVFVIVIVIVILAVAPKRARLVVPRVEELEILPVCHLIPIDGKRRDVNSVSFVLVVPAKQIAVAREAKCNGTGGNFDAPVIHRRSNAGEGFVLPYFAIQRQLMQHVGQRFRMHEAVLNGYVEQSAQGKSVAGGMVRIAKRIRELVVQNCSDFPDVVLHRSKRRPVRG